MNSLLEKAVSVEQFEQAQITASIDEFNSQLIQRWSDKYHFYAAPEYLNKGICPSCGRKKLWIRLSNLSTAVCGHSNCTFIGDSRVLFPDLYEGFNKKYQATPANPNKTADIYLGITKGIAVNKIQGWYEQAKHWEPSSNQGTASVRFWLDAEKTLAYSHFVEPVTEHLENGKQAIKTFSTKGQVSGLWWQPPTLVINERDSLVITDSIFNAIAFNLSGVKAVALVDGKFPKKSVEAHKFKGITFVFAYGNDAEGRKKTRIHAKNIRVLHEKSTAWLASGNTNLQAWDEIIQQGKFTAKDKTQYQHFGQLELAQSPHEKALIIWKNKPDMDYFIFDFIASTWRVKVNLVELGKAKQEMLEPDPAREDEATENAFLKEAKLQKIATFKMDYRYFQEPESGEDERYVFKVDFENNIKNKLVELQAKNLTSEKDFLLAMMRNPGGLYEGTKKDVLHLYRTWMETKHRVVKSIDFIGYHKPTKTYVFKDYAVKNGKIYPVNADGYFQIDQVGIRSTHEVEQTLNTDEPVDFWQDYKLAFGTKGMLAMCNWIGSAFAEQIADMLGFYPFFEIWGTPDSGKSSMVILLWKLYGRNNPVFNPNSKNTTAAGRSRAMCDVGNMPMTINEADHEIVDKDQKTHSARFTWEFIKDLYERVTGDRKGAMGSGNSNKQYIPKFKGAVWAIQNPHIVADEAIKTRFITLMFDRSHHTTEGYEASKRLELLKINQLCGFFFRVITQEHQFLDGFEAKYRQYVKQLQGNPQIKINRIIHNHALMMALADTLHLVLPVTDADIRSIKEYAIELAIEKQEEQNKDDPTLQSFWDMFELFNTKALVGGGVTENAMNHSNRPDDEIAINITLFNQVLAEHKLKQFEEKELRRLFPYSRRYKFIQHKNKEGKLENTKLVNSPIEGKKVRVYVFEIQK